MFSFLDTKIGLDIGRDSIKLIEIKETLFGFKIEKNIRYKIPYDETGNTDTEELKKLLEKILDENTHKEITASISHDIIFVKEIAAGKNREETEKNIDLLILNSLPVDKNELVIRYKKIKDKILCIALDKSFYVKNARILKILEPYAEFLSVEPLAMRNALNFSEKYKNSKDNIAIVNVGAMRVSITILKAGNLYGCRILPGRGMFSLSERIKDSQNISFREAELLRRSAILDKDTEIIIKDYVKEITDEIKYTTADLKISTIVIGGGGFGLKNLKAGFEEIFTEAVIDDTPVAPEKFKASKEEKAPHAFFTQALGLALNDSNAINFPFNPENTKKRKFSFSYIYALVAFFALILIFTINLNIKTSYLTKQVKSITEKMNNVFTQTFGREKIVDPYLQMQQKIQTASGFNSSISQIEILKEIKSLLPKDGKTILTSLKIDMQKISLSGQSLNYNSVEIFKTNIKNSKSFSDISFRTDNKSKDYIEFTLKMDFK